MSKFFPNHVLSEYSKEPVERIVYRKPGTNLEKMEFMLHNNSLIILGDFGEAIYQWSQKIDFEFLADCELDYFHSKCISVPRICSEPNFEYWDHEKALKTLESMDITTSGNKIPIYALSEMKGNLNSAYEWGEYLREEFDEYFGLYEDEQNFVYDIGRVIHPWCEKHLQALKDIWSILQDEQEKNTQVNPTDNVVYFGGR